MPAPLPRPRPPRPLTRAAHTSGLLLAGQYRSGAEADGLGSSAQFYEPCGLTLGSSGTIGYAVRGGEGRDEPCGLTLGSSGTIGYAVR